MQCKACTAYKIQWTIGALVARGPTYSLFWRGGEGKTNDARPTDTHLASTTKDVPSKGPFALFDQILCCYIMHINV